MSNVIRGRIVALDENRSVFVGVRGGSDSTYLRFVSDDRSETKFRLSLEAVAALRAILNNEGRGEPHEMTLIDRGTSVWAAVEEKSAP